MANLEQQPTTDDDEAHLEKFRSLLSRHEFLPDEDGVSFFSDPECLKEVFDDLPHMGFSNPRKIVILRLSGEKALVVDPGVTILTVSEERRLRIGQYPLYRMRTYIQSKVNVEGKGDLLLIMQE